MPVETLAAKCPEPTPIIERGFRVSPPLCLVARAGFQFVYKKNPDRPGYAKETFADAGLMAAARMIDDDACLRLVAEWIKIERDADKGVN